MRTRCLRVLVFVVVGVVFLVFSLLYFLKTVLTAALSFSVCLLAFYNDVQKMLHILISSFVDRCIFGAVLVNSIVWLQGARTGAESEAVNSIVWLQGARTGAESEAVNSIVWLQGARTGAESEVVNSIVWLQGARTGTESEAVNSIVWLQGARTGADSEVVNSIVWLQGACSIRSCEVPS